MLKAEYLKTDSGDNTLLGLAYFMVQEELWCVIAKACESWGLFSSVLVVSGYARIMLPVKL